MVWDNSPIPCRPTLVAAKRTLTSHLALILATFVVAKWYNVIRYKDSVIFVKALTEIIEPRSLTFSPPL